MYFSYDILYFSVFYVRMKKTGKGKTMKDPQLLHLDKIEPNHIFCNIYGLPQHWEKDEGYSFEGNPRKDHGFMYIIDGQIKFTEKDGRVTIARSGNLLYLPKFSEYKIKVEKASLEYTDILANFNICDFEGGEYCLSSGITTLFDDTPLDIQESMMSLGLISTNTKYPALRATKAFYSILQKLLAHSIIAKESNFSGGRIAPALFYIENHISESLSVPELARMCLMSESAFRKSFSAAVGMSPAQYKKQLKINKAKELLESSPEVSISAISEMLDFYDISYFYRSFIAATGKTPKQYREEAEKA